MERKVTPDYETDRTNSGRRTVGRFVMRMLAKLKRKRKPVGPMAVYYGAGAPLIPYPVTDEEAEWIINTLVPKDALERLDRDDSSRK